MGKLYGQSFVDPHVELIAASQYSAPDMINSAALSGRAMYPRITGSNPGTRECLVGFMPGYAEYRMNVSGILVYCGDNASKTSLKSRFAIVGKDGMFYSGTVGVDTTLPTDVISGLTMAAGVTSATALTAAGGSSSRWMRYNFDQTGVIAAGTPFWVRVLTECEYSVTDSATLWANNWWINYIVAYPHSEGGAGLSGASYRSLLGVSLLTGGIDTITDASMASPGTAGVQHLIGGSSTTISTKTVDIGAVNGFNYWLICER